MTSRKNGFYWVKLSGEWIPGEYRYDTMYPWQVLASDEILDEGELEAVGDEIELPEKYRK